MAQQLQEGEELFSLSSDSPEKFYKAGASGSEAPAPEKKEGELGGDPGLHPQEVEDKARKEAPKCDLGPWDRRRRGWPKFREVAIVGPRG